MNKIRKHIPNCCSGVTEEENEFNSYNEFMDTPIIKNTIEWYGNTFKGVSFRNFIIKPLCRTFIVQCLYTENKEDKNCVVGYLDNTNHLENLFAK